MSGYLITQVAALVDQNTGALIGFRTADGKEWLVPSGLTTASVAFAALNGSASQAFSAASLTCSGASSHGGLATFLAGLTSTAGATALGATSVTTLVSNIINRSGLNLELQLAGGAGDAVRIGGNGTNPTTFNAQSGAATFTGIVTANAGVSVAAGVLSPASYTSATAPAYVKGGQYFDTTLNKLRIGGATAWETVTSA